MPSVEVLQKYAEAIVKIGANVKKDQEVLIYAGVNDEYFVKYVVEECYKAQAKRVHIVWQSDLCTRLKYEYETTEVMSEVLSFEEERLKYENEVALPARIYIESEDPDMLKGIDQDKLSTVRAKRGAVIMPYREKSDNKYQWNIVAIPGKAWAKKVFPNLSEEKAMDALWDAVLKTIRITDDPVKAWNEHNAFLEEKKTKLNNLRIKYLRYKSSNGTDFTVQLHRNVVFDAGSAYTLDGIIYNPNMPTEECFTSPVKKSAEGVVYASKPLSVMGNVVSDFGFRFHHGKVVEVLSDKPEEKKVLENLISIDEGASHLGEVALVPFNSPINETGLLFYNTLFDENACCHLALGRAFTECIRDFDKLNEDEINAVGLNKSIIHVDFMIGTSDLYIEAETFDGEKVVIFKDGVFAI